MVSADIIAEMCVGDFSVLAVVSGLFLHLWHHKVAVDLRHLPWRVRIDVVQSLRRSVFSLSSVLRVTARITNFNVAGQEISVAIVRCSFSDFSKQVPKLIGATNSFTVFRV